MTEENKKKVPFNRSLRDGFEIHNQMKGGGVGIGRASQERTEARLVTSIPNGIHQIKIQLTEQQMKDAGMEYNCRVDVTWSKEQQRIGIFSPPANEGQLLRKHQWPKEKGNPEAGYNHFPEVTVRLGEHRFMKDLVMVDGSDPWEASRRFTIHDLHTEPGAIIFSLPTAIKTIKT